MNLTKNSTVKINIQHLKNSYPKIRPPLSKGITLFFDKHYKDNRENFILQLIESWLHRSIIGRRQKDKKVLEIGAGSLNHLKYENITVNTEYSFLNLIKNNFKILHIVLYLLSMY